MANFAGQLNSNEIFSALYNMIISQQVFADNIGKHQTLVDKARVDGGLYGDTKLFYATDALASAAWGNDAEAANLLNLYRPDAPECQAITLDVFRQICLTVDNYLSKRAWSDEGAFSSFNSVMKGWIGETKKIYDGTLYNVYVGTTKTTEGNQSQSITLDDNLTAEERAKYIAEKVANIIVEMGDYTRDYNDYGFLRSYADSDIKLVWNSKYVNEIRKVDLPAIFHKEGLMDKFDENTMPAKYFGRDMVVSTDVGENKAIAANGEVAVAGKVRTKVEKTFTFSGEKVHLFPGDALAVGVKVDYTGGSVSNPDFDEEEVYIQDEKVICKILVKLPPYMSAFEVGTSFFNPKSLTETNYLTFGHNTIEYLKNYPFITLVEA